MTPVKSNSPLMKPLTNDAINLKLYVRFSYEALSVSKYTVFFAEYIENNDRVTAVKFKYSTFFSKLNAKWDTENHKID